MNTSTVCEPMPAGRTATRASAAVGLRVELGPIVQAVTRDLAGAAVSGDRIEVLLQQLLDQEFSDARVTTFLPIFLHRYACETLRAELARAEPGSA